MTALLDRVATALDHRLNRRGFIAKSALAGTAMAVAPTDYLLKPVGAYQAICSCSNTACDCGSMCCDGYTEFCCTLIGMNRCPPGHILGGWWKVDNSEFCNNAPRYYMDCNAPCNGCGCGSNGICSGSCSGTTCGCARGWCGFRKSGCVNFRYGQCNQATQCIGPIVCRVVTCVPPWTLDATCTRTIAVDEFTRFHNAGCLTRPYGSLDQVSPTRDGIFIKGWAFDPNTSDPVTLHVYVDGQVALWLVADRNRPDVAEAVPGAGPRHGFEAEIRVPEGNHTVTVYAINLLEGTESPVIGSAPVGVGTPFGTFDAQAGPGFIRVVGWVIDPDMPGGTTTVHAYVDGAFAGAYETNVFRNDVAAAYAAYGGEHGFDLQLPVGPGEHRVQLWVINDGGADQPLLLGDRTIAVGGAAIGYIDAIHRTPNGLRVVGWALDPDSSEPLDIHAYVDGAFVGSRMADIDRPDVEAAVPNFGSRHGYDFEVPAVAGTRQVTVYAIGRGGGAPYTKLGTQTVQVGSLPFGHIDAALDDSAGVRVRGWAIDPDSAGPVDIHIYVDGAFAGAGRTGVDRPDVVAAYPGYPGARGYDFVVPAPAGRRTVCAYAINVGAGGANHPMLGCTTANLT